MRGCPFSFGVMMSEQPKITLTGATRMQCAACSASKEIRQYPISKSGVVGDTCLACVRKQQVSQRLEQRERVADKALALYTSALKSAEAETPRAQDFLKTVLADFGGMTQFGQAFADNLKHSYQQTKGSRHTLDAFLKLANLIVLNERGLPPPMSVKDLDDEELRRILAQETGAIQKALEEDMDEFQTEEPPLE